MPSARQQAPAPPAPPPSPAGDGRPAFPWSTLLPPVAALLAVAILILWFRSHPALPLDERRPGADGEPPGNARGVVEQTDLSTGGQFSGSAVQPPPLPGSWTRFRGARSDNVSTDPTPLAETWPAGGPKKLWAIDLGEGHAGPVVRDGRVYLLDYDETRRADTLLCLALADGTELWRRSYRVTIKRNHGVSRTVPALDGRFVVSLGPKCHLLCADAFTGAFLWGIDLRARFGAQTPNWYTGQCPLIHEGIAVVAPGGSALLVGIDCASGQVRWQTPNPDSWKMSHSSIMLLELLGQPTYVYVALGGTVGVSAAAPDRGRVLWKTDALNVPVVAPSPVRLAPDRVLLTAGYGSGSVIVEVARQGDTWSARALKRFEKTEFACEQHTPILYRDHLFTIMPKDAGPLREQLVCARTDGTLAWSSAEKARFGLGPYLIADGKILILDDDGTLTLARADTTRWMPLAQAKVLDGRDAWAPMALVAGRLLLRDSKRMLCLDLTR